MLLSLHDLNPAIVVLMNLNFNTDRFPSAASTNNGSDGSIPIEGIPGTIMLNKSFADFSTHFSSVSLQGCTLTSVNLNVKVKYLHARVYENGNRGTTSAPTIYLLKYFTSVTLKINFHVRKFKALDIEQPVHLRLVGDI